MVDRAEAVIPFASTLEWILTGNTVFYDRWGDRASYNADGSFLYEIPSEDISAFVPAPGYEFFDGARQINYETPRIDEYLFYDNNLWIINPHDVSSIVRVQESNPGNWEINKAPIFETLDDSGDIVGKIFAISRDEQSIGTAETYYISTVQDQGWINEKIYDGFANVEINFTPEQSMGFVTVDFLDDRDMTSDKEFSLIVQADPNDPIDTYHAHTTFTVPVTEESIDSDYVPTSLDLEYAARVISYGIRDDFALIQAIQDDDPDSEWLEGNYQLPEGYTISEVFSQNSSVRDPGFLAVAMTSANGEPILSIRGTVGGFFEEDWISNFDPIGIGVAQLDAAWSHLGLESWLRENPGAHITGHSQGGAQAQALASIATAAGIEIGNVATFNSPGIPWELASAFSAYNAGDIQHFISSGDIISKVGTDYIPGEVLYYYFDKSEISISDGITPISDLIDFIFESHTSHWSQPMMTDYLEASQYKYFEQLAKNENWNLSPNGFETVSEKMYFLDLMSTEFTFLGQILQDIEGETYRTPFDRQFDHFTDAISAYMSDISKLSNIAMFTPLITISDSRDISAIAGKDLKIRRDWMEAFEKAGGLSFIEEIRNTNDFFIDNQITIDQPFDKEINQFEIDGSNVFLGSELDNSISISLGSNIVDLGLGYNSVQYSYSRNDVSVEKSSENLVVVDKQDIGFDALFNIDRIDFDDGSLLYDIDGANLGFTYRIYAAAYGRTPDEDGLRFWVDTKDFLTSNEPERDSFDFLAREFLTAPEFLALYGDDPSDMDYVDAMYQNVLGRLPDQEGYDFWVGAMEDGQDRADILVYFAESFENQEQTAPDLNDGIWVV